MYRWILWLHILSAMAFMISHGASALMAFQIRREKKAPRVRALLDLSGGLWLLMAISFLLLLISGIVAGIMGRWWTKGWIWLSILIFLLMVVIMTWFSGRHYHPIRKLAGMPYMDGGKERPAEKPAPDLEIQHAVSQTAPGALLATGGLGTAVVLWLMLFKPF